METNETKRREITFPGCGDKKKEENPYGDFIIFHEILKFMVWEKDGLDKTGVIFLTYEKTKGDWINSDLTPITHYIEKAFLVTNKTLFIVYADKLLKISFENIHKSDQQEFPPKIWLEDKLYSMGKSRLFLEAYMAHYRGWTIALSLDSTDKNWIAIGLNALCYSYANFIEVSNDDNIALTVIGQCLPTKEETYTAIKCEIDEISERM